MNPGLIVTAAIPIAFMLDFVIGDPEWLPHPVRLIGAVISFFEKLLRKPSDSENKAKSRMCGAVLVAAVLTITAGAGLALDFAAYKIHPLCFFAVQVVLSTFCLAARSLCNASMAVYRELEKGDLKAARKMVSMIVGRDTDRLDEAGVARAAIESVAESASDGVIAPCFYIALGGASFGLLYKAVNTMDSMLGYKNDKYRYFGTAAAKLDDIVNFIPARISGLAMVAAAYLTGLDGKNSWRIFVRDRFNHASPNSAQTESACAGALGVRLAGDAWYFGKLVKKPYIGDALREVEKEDIKKANRQMYAAAFLSMLIFFGVRLGIIWILRLGAWF